MVWNLEWGWNDIESKSIWSWWLPVTVVLLVLFVYIGCMYIQSILRRLRLLLVLRWHCNTGCVGSPQKETVSTEFFRNSTGIWNLVTALFFKLQQEQWLTSYSWSYIMSACIYCYGKVASPGNPLFRRPTHLFLFAAVTAHITPCYPFCSVHQMMRSYVRS